MSFISCSISVQPKYVDACVNKHFNKNVTSDTGITGHTYYIYVPVLVVPVPYILTVLDISLLERDTIATFLNFRGIFRYHISIALLVYFCFEIKHYTHIINIR